MHRSDSFRPILRRNFTLGKAHRKKQGDCVVTYAEPLLRSNDASRKITKLNSEASVNAYHLRRNK